MRGDPGRGQSNEDQLARRHRLLVLRAKERILNALQDITSDLQRIVSTCEDVKFLRIIADNVEAYQADLESGLPLIPGVEEYQANDETEDLEIQATIEASHRLNAAQSKLQTMVQDTHDTLKYCSKVQQDTADDVGVELSPHLPDNNRCQQSVNQDGLSSPEYETVSVSPNIHLMNDERDTHDGMVSTIVAAPSLSKAVRESPSEGTSKMSLETNAPQDTVGAQNGEEEDGAGISPLNAGNGIVEIVDDVDYTSQSPEVQRKLSVAGRNYAYSNRDNVPDLGLLSKGKRKLIDSNEPTGNIEQQNSMGDSAKQIEPGRQEHGTDVLQEQSSNVSKLDEPKQYQDESPLYEPPEQDSNVELPAVITGNSMDVDDIQIGRSSPPEAAMQVQVTTPVKEVSIRISDSAVKKKRKRKGTIQVEPSPTKTPKTASGWGNFVVSKEDAAQVDSVPTLLPITPKATQSQEPVVTAAQYYAYQAQLRAAQGQAPAGKLDAPQMNAAAQAYAASHAQHVAKSNKYRVQQTPAQGAVTQHGPTPSSSKISYNSTAPYNGSVAPSAHIGYAPKTPTGPRISPTKRPWTRGGFQPICTPVSRGKSYHKTHGRTNPNWSSGMRHQPPPISQNDARPTPTRSSGVKNCPPPFPPGFEKFSQARRDGAPSPGAQERDVPHSPHTQEWAEKC
ncbi:hypothetical protein EDC01DRAFT_634125 [Geopyxis carbonaria]|nr:hypothetical protein EDC01DRAFT_634125 [Geopyxis carbonaria]